MILMGEMNRVQVARKGMEININQHKETERNYKTKRGIGDNSDDIKK